MKLALDGDRWCRGRRWKALVQGKTHCGNLLLLIDDDFLRDTFQGLIMAIAKFSHSHIDGTLMMRNHHGDKILVDILCWRRTHVRHHDVHSLIAKLMKIAAD